MKSGPQDGRSPSRTIDERIKELGDWRGKMLSRLPALVKQADLGVVEEWKWRGVPVWSHDGLICTGETYANVVKMTFFQGRRARGPLRPLQLQPRWQHSACHRLPRGREDRREGAKGPDSRRCGVERDPRPLIEPADAPPRYPVPLLLTAGYSSPPPVRAPTR